MASINFLDFGATKYEYIVRGYIMISCFETPITVAWAVDGVIRMGRHTFTCVQVHEIVCSTNKSFGFVLKQACNKYFIVSLKNTKFGRIIL